MYNFVNYTALINKFLNLKKKQRMAKISPIKNLKFV